MSPTSIAGSQNLGFVYKISVVAAVIQLKAQILNTVFIQFVAHDNFTRF